MEQISAAGQKAGESYSLEARFRQAASGEYRWFLKRSIPVRDASGHLQKRIGISIDIEYSVSHDMRAPLRALQGFSQLLLKTHESSLDARSLGFANDPSSL